MTPRRRWGVQKLVKLDGGGERWMMAYTHPFETNAREALGNMRRSGLQVRLVARDAPEPPPWEPVPE